MWKHTNKIGIKIAIDLANILERNRLTPRNISWELQVFIPSLLSPQLVNNLVLRIPDLMYKRKLSGMLSSRPGWVPNDFKMLSEKAFSKKT